MTIQGRAECNQTVVQYSFGSIMKSNKVQNPRRNKFSAVVELYRDDCASHCAPLIDGLGHATWSAT